MINVHKLSMVMKSKLLPFILLIMALISCSEKDTIPELKSSDVPKELIGTWLWNYDYGGIFFTKYTPQSTGLKMEIRFDADHNYKYFENNILLINTKFILKNGVSITGNHNALIINNIPSSPKSIVFKDQDSLILFDEWRTGFEHHYSRLK